MAASWEDAEAAPSLDVDAVRDDFERQMNGVRAKIDAAERGHRERLREKIEMARRERSEAEARARERHKVTGRAGKTAATEAAAALARETAAAEATEAAAVDAAEREMVADLARDLDEMAACFRVVRHQRLAGDVRAGHDQSQVLRVFQPCGSSRPTRRLMEQQIVDGRRR